MCGLFKYNDLRRVLYRRERDRNPSLATTREDGKRTRACFDAVPVVVYNKQMKVRRNALHRATEEMKHKLEKYHISINQDAGIGISRIGTFTFHHHITKEQCKAAMRQQMRTIDTTEALQADMKHDKDQGTLF